MVFRHLNAILMFVFLIMFVTLRAHLRGNIGACYPSFVFVHICLWCGVLCFVFYLVS